MLQKSDDMGFTRAAAGFRDGFRRNGLFWRIIWKAACQFCPAHHQIMVEAVLLYGSIPLRDRIKKSDPVYSCAGYPQQDAPLPAVYDK